MKPMALIAAAACTGALVVGPRLATDAPGSTDPGAGPSVGGAAAASGTEIGTGFLESLRDIAGPVGKASRASIARSVGGAPMVLGRRSSTAAPPRQQAYAHDKPFHQFFFTRARYSGRSRGGGGRFRGGGGGGRPCDGSWCIDWWEADYTFSTIIDEFLDVDVYVGENSPRLDDPELRRFPFLYALEVGGMALYPQEVEGLRSYLLQGGFLVIDDFWGDYEWQNFVYEIAQVLPEYPIVDIPFEHPVLHTVYDVETIIQVPSIGNARSGYPSECGPCQPFVKGIFDEKGRLMVIINGNTDLGDAWEWADHVDYPTYYSTYAFFMGMNMIVYALAN
jgi:hypothetical protein